MEKVLRLDLAGNPTAWLTREDAAMLYAKELVVWELGDQKSVMIGGVNEKGVQSSLEMRPVIATAGSVSHAPRRARTLTNASLFRRDNHRCLYCGGVFTRDQLTRDHVIPRSKGGKDVWENVVAACKRCNNAKADRTPEEAGLTLLAVPFRPNVFESMFLAQHKVLADQMAYLEKQFSGQREWRKASA